MNLLRIAIVFCIMLSHSIASAEAFSVKHAVTPIKQPSKMSCWAASTAMLHNWKLGIEFPIEDVVKIAGPTFEQIYQASFANPPQGIDPANEAKFYDALGLATVKGLNPTIEGWRSILSEHGPLSVTVDAVPGQGYIHALVVTGLDGDGTAKNTIVTYIDPADGKSHDVWFSDFLKLYEGSSSWPLQIIHFP